MARKGGSKEGLANDPSMSMPSEQKTNESNKQKISRIHDTFPSATKDNIAKILQFYADDESQAIDAITRDGGREALSAFADTGSLKNKNNKNKKKKKKPKKDAVSGLATTASFDADDSSSLHSSGNVDAELDKECQRVENGNGFFPDVADEIESINTTLTNHERLQDSEEPLSLNLETRSAISTPDQEVCQSPPDSSSEKFKEPCNYSRTNSPPRKREVESPPCASPLSDNSEKLDEQESKRDKSRQDSDHYKHAPRQRTSSYRRSKTSSLSEDSSSQHNSQSLYNKRGIEKCKKDLNRQTISLNSRIHSLVEKGLEDSAKKIKNIFGDLQKQLDNRKKEVELELEKRKGEALQLIKSRQELAVDLKRRVDRSPTMSDAEWNELKSDIKLFVVERKYDEELGKTIWFQWADISDNIKSFGEVQPVKNAYSQRSSSVATSTEAAQNNLEPSPASSLANEVDYAADKSDVAATASSNPVDEAYSTTKEEETSAIKNKPNENQRTFNRVYSNSNKRFPRFSNNFPGRFQGNRGGAYSRPYNNRNYGNRYPNEEYRQQHNYQGRDNRTNENQSYSGGDRNMNNYYRKNERGRGQHTTRYNNQYQHQHRHPNRHNTDNAAAPTEPTLKTTEPKPAVVNGVENN